MNTVDTHNKEAIMVEKFAEVKQSLKTSESLENFESQIGEFEGLDEVRDATLTIRMVNIDQDRITKEGFKKAVTTIYANVKKLGFASYLDLPQEIRDEIQEAGKKFGIRTIGTMSNKAENMEELFARKEGLSALTTRVNNNFAFWQKSGEDSTPQWRNLRRSLSILNDAKTKNEVEKTDLQHAIRYILTTGKREGSLASFNELSPALMSDIQFIANKHDCGFEIEKKKPDVEVIEENEVNEFVTQVNENTNKTRGSMNKLLTAAGITVFVGAAMFLTTQNAEAKGKKKGPMFNQILKMIKLGEVTLPGDKKEKEEAAKDRIKGGEGDDEEDEEKKNMKELKKKVEKAKKEAAARKAAAAKKAEEEAKKERENANANEKSETEEEEKKGPNQGNNGGGNEEKEENDEKMKKKNFDPAHGEVKRQLTETNWTKNMWITLEEFNSHKLGEVWEKTVENIPSYVIINRAANHVFNGTYLKAYKSFHVPVEYYAHFFSKRLVDEELAKNKQETKKANENPEPEIIEIDPEIETKEEGTKEEQTEKKVNPPADPNNGDDHTPVEKKYDEHEEKGDKKFADTIKNKLSVGINKFGAYVGSTWIGSIFGGGGPGAHFDKLARFWKNLGKKSNQDLLEGQYNESLAAVDTIEKKAKLGTIKRALTSVKEKTLNGGKKMKDIIKALVDAKKKGKDGSKNLAENDKPETDPATGHTPILDKKYNNMDTNDEKLAGATDDPGKVGINGVGGNVTATYAGGAIVPAAGPKVQHKNLKRTWVAEKNGSNQDLMERQFLEALEDVRTRHSLGSSKSQIKKNNTLAKVNSGGHRGGRRG